MCWRWASWIIVAVAMAGCFQRDIVDCGDGTACPGGYTYLAGGGCASPEQFAACTGAAIPDDESCFVDNLGFGTCVAGACIVRICGNGRLEPGEACDDGNDISGDECNATCTSTGKCGNGVTDPGEECDGQADCRSDCKIARCGNGLPDPGETCDDGNLAVGDGCTPDCMSNETCGNGIGDLGEECDGTPNCRPDCIIARCGNGLLDGNEVCDDGNLVASDDCTPDCSSNNKCGNGVLDFFVEERCEDGNTLDHDGCDKNCEFEDVTWNRVGTQRKGLQGTAIAEDGHRGRLVLFGGSDDFAAVSNETWEWSGKVWRQLFPQVSPPPRWSHAMVYDSKRRRVVLFGGLSPANAPLGDTWELDGNTWVQRFPAHAPSPRANHAMAYDIARQQVVLVGGAPDGVTWLWDGVDWTPAADTSPLPRQNTALAYDSDRAVVVMYGGLGYSGNGRFADLWLWNGASWTEVVKATPTTPWPNPAPRSHHALVYDRARKKTLLVAGEGTNNNVGASVFGLDATGWTTLPALPSAGCTVTNLSMPQPETLSRQCDRELHSAAFFAATQTTIVWGGHFGAAHPRDALELALGASTWTIVPLPAVVPARLGSAMVYDSLSAKTVLFGGIGSVDFLGDTWLWDGHAWTDTQLAPPNAPSSRSDHVLVEDPRRQQLVLQGGEDADGFRGDTWLFQNGAWTSDAGSPGAFSQQGAALSPSLDIVLVGGTETWTWNGAWMSESPATSPTSGAYAAMALDARRSRTLLVAQGETLEWTGTTWLTAASLPDHPNRTGHAITYDPLRGVCVLYGGSEIANFYGDTLGWNGTTWTPIVPGGGDPGIRTGHAMTYDAARSELLVFGGYTTTTNAYLGDTWVQRWDGTGIDEACHSGVDLDDDGKIGCADEECWPWCDPLCPPGKPSCNDPNRPYCGDGECSVIESYHACPVDCFDQIDPKCGDFVCDPGEVCAGECP